MEQDPEDCQAREHEGQERRAPGEWVAIPTEHLRIVPEALWVRVGARLKQVGEVFARRLGGRFLARAGRLDGESPYLMSGYLKCGPCTGAIGGSTPFHGNGPTHARKRVTTYACNVHRKRGATICGNATVVKTEIVDVALLDAIRKVVDPSMLDEAVDRPLAVLPLTRQESEARRAAVERDLAEVETRLGRIVQGHHRSRSPTRVSALKALDQGLPVQTQSIP